MTELDRRKVEGKNSFFCLISPHKESPNFWHFLKIIEFPLPYWVEVDGTPTTIPITVGVQLYGLKVSHLNVCGSGSRIKKASDLNAENKTGSFKHNWPVFCNPFGPDSFEVIPRSFRGQVDARLLTWGTYILLAFHRLDQFLYWNWRILRGISLLFWTEKKLNRDALVEIVNN